MKRCLVNGDLAITFNEIVLEQNLTTIVGIRDYVGLICLQKTVVELYKALVVHET